MKDRQLFSYHFIAVALLAFLNCPDRSDYNLPLAIFAFLLWNFRPYTQKHRILWILLASIICDAIWILTVTVGEWTQNNEGNQLRGLTQGLSLIILFLYAVISIQQCQDLLSVSGFRKNVLYFE